MGFMSRSLGLSVLLALGACTQDESRWARPPMPTPPPEGLRVLERLDRNTGNVVRRWSIRYAANGQAFLDGPELLYWPDGALRAERNWVDGEATGLWKSFYANGTLKMRVSHVDYPTSMVFFHPDGTVSAQGLASKGVKNGDWAHFHSDGSLSHQGAYVRGMKQGTWTYYHPGGGLAKRGNYLDAHATGDWRRWENEPATWADAWWPEDFKADAPASKSISSPK